jgi:site-specific recombinase XerD
VRRAVRARHYSRRTEEAYVGWVRRFVLFHDKRHPERMGEEEVGRFLTWLAVERKVSAVTQTQALSAIIFQYREVLRQEVGWIANVVRAKPARRLPVVLTPGRRAPSCSSFPASRGSSARFSTAPGYDSSRGCACA